MKALIITMGILILMLILNTFQLDFYLRVL